MAVPVLVIGRSGCGKSTSLRNFGADEITLINVAGKPLPFKKKFSDVLNSDEYSLISQKIRDSDKDSIVIDDAGYLITNHFMRGHSSAGKGNAIFTLYNELADNFWRLIDYIKTRPSEKIVYFIMHEDRNDLGDVKPKTIGRLLDEKVCVEGLFTIVLHAMKFDGRYIFKTNSDGSDVTKSPMDMFPDEIDNDLKAVDAIIRQYYEFGGTE